MGEEGEERDGRGDVRALMMGFGGCCGLFIYLGGGNERECADGQTDSLDR